MGYLIDGYKIMGKELAAYAVKHRAGIGTAVSVGGTIVSNILSTKAGAKSARMIDSREAEIGRPLSMKEKAELCWKNHAAPAAVALVSSGGAIYSHNQHVKDFNKVALAYSGIKKLYDSGKQATREVLGEKKNAELQDKLNQKYLEEHPEVKQAIKDNKYNPDPSTKQKFWETTTGISFFATVDEIELAIKTMNAEMQALKPRTPGAYICNEPKCIRLSRLFELLNVSIPKGVKEAESFKNLAFLKGSEFDDSDSDKIEAYYTPMIIDDETMETCAALNWVTSPSDLRYGDYLKL